MGYALAILGAIALIAAGLYINTRSEMLMWQRYARYHEAEHNKLYLKAAVNEEH